MNMKNEEKTIVKVGHLVPSKKQSPAIATGEALIAQAIDKNVPVETMEKLLAMRRELRQEDAKEKFNKAMAQFQAKCPTIGKTKKVMEKDNVHVRYQYAPLDSIVEQVKGALSDCGLSYSIDVEQDDKYLGVICRVTHEAGHSEISSFKVPIGSEGYMSDVQKYGARLTFAKRYAFCNAFGILTGDEDTDAVGEDAGKKVVSKPVTQPAAPIKQIMMTEFQKKKITALLTEKGKTLAAALSYCQKAFNKQYPNISVAEANLFIVALEKLKSVSNEYVDPEEVIAGMEAAKK
jgi:hypothetical protein